MSKLVRHRVRLVWCDDPYTQLKPGDEGTVMMTDSLGNIHVTWDSGSTLGLVRGHDRWEQWEEEVQDAEVSGAATRDKQAR